jgi:hypothetical protein
VLDIPRLDQLEKYLIMPMSACQSKKIFFICRFLYFHRFDENGLIPSAGVEFVLSVRGSVALDTSLTKVEKDVYITVCETVDAVLSKRLS